MRIPRGTAIKRPQLRADMPMELVGALLADWQVAIWQDMEARGVVLCPTCGGEGGRHGEGGDRGEWVFHECPTCEGVGEVDETTAADAPVGDWDLY